MTWESFSKSALLIAISPLHLLGPSPTCSLETLPTMLLLTSITKSTPSVLHRHLILQVLKHLLVLLSERLWAPETDDTYKPLILVASPSVQSIAFPELQDISFGTSILRPTASAYTSQGEPSRLSTIDESPSSATPSIVSSSSSSLMPTVIVSLSSPPSLPPTVHFLPPAVRSPLLQVPPAERFLHP